jgi:hypothetical protein
MKLQCPTYDDGGGGGDDNDSILSNSMSRPIWVKLAAMANAKGKTEVGKSERNCRYVAWKENAVGL